MYTKVVKEMEQQVKTAAIEADRANETRENVEAMAYKVNGMADSVVEITKFVELQLTNIETTARQSQEVAAIAEETSAVRKKSGRQRKNKSSSIEQADEMASALKETIRRALSTSLASLTGQMKSGSSLKTSDSA